ncbi:outer membrane protein [Thalassorhabdomicrobium marinisediminis]|uniref:outer membrane protein n=1 Tax=Thalassorhabdomicrobium marinisediminis TaxID=2170577 RepID=UPI0024906222|nr:outer membrane beta-barrel protein [Thalassorhabdomicrobium marinisediminis]
MIRTTLLASGLALASTAAFAGNLSAPVVVAPVAPVAPVVVPTADWTGFYAGAQYVTGDANLDDGFGDFDLDLDGYGVHAGYLYDMGSFVLGGELDYDKLTVDVFGTDADADVLRAKAIAGYDLGSFMPYLTAGVAKIDVEDGGAEDTAKFYGIGGAFQATDMFRVGVEALRHQQDDFDNSGFDVEIDTISLRASFTF